MAWQASGALPPPPPAMSYAAACVMTAAAQQAHEHQRALYATLGAGGNPFLARSLLNHGRTTTSTSSSAPAGFNSATKEEDSIQEDGDSDGENAGEIVDTDSVGHQKGQEEDDDDRESRLSADELCEDIKDVDGEDDDLVVERAKSRESPKSPLDLAKERRGDGVDERARESPSRPASAGSESVHSVENNVDRNGSALHPVALGALPPKVLPPLVHPSQHHQQHLANIVQPKPVISFSIDDILGKSRPKDHSSTPFSQHRLATTPNSTNFGKVDSMVRFPHPSPHHTTLAGYGVSVSAINIQPEDMEDEEEEEIDVDSDDNHNTRDSFIMRKDLRSVDDEGNSLSTEDAEKYSWLQCTRYKPPKLPRSKKNSGGVKKRKLGRNPRVPFTQHQVAVLETKFRHTHYLSSVDVAELSAALNLTETRVKIWFQNRRARERRDKDSGGNGSGGPGGPDHLSPATSVGAQSPGATTGGPALSPADLHHHHHQQQQLHHQLHHHQQQKPSHLPQAPPPPPPPHTHPALYYSSMWGPLAAAAAFDARTAHALAASHAAAAAAMAAGGSPGAAVVPGMPVTSSSTAAAAGVGGGPVVGGGPRGASAFTPVTFRRYV